MTRIISITMAIIIMLSAGLAAPPMNISTLTAITASAKIKPSPQKKKTKPKKKKKHIHYMPKGNITNISFVQQNDINIILFQRLV